MENMSIAIIESSIAYILKLSFSLLSTSVALHYMSEIE